MKPAPAAPLDTPFATLRALGNTALFSVTQLNANLFLETTITAVLTMILSLLDKKDLQRSPKGDR